MAPSMKISLLALVGSAAAVPGYGHSKFHHKPSSVGYAGPSGGWGTNTTTSRTAPVGTATTSADGYPTTTIVGDDLTTTLLETQTSTETLIKTIYATKPSKPVGGEEPSSVAAVDVPTGGAVCGPATVYVTATEKVTVTVPAGGYPESSKKHTTTTVVLVPAPAPTTETAAVPVASSEVPSYVVEEPTTSVVKEEEKPSSTAAVPTSSYVEVPAPAPTTSSTSEVYKPSTTSTSSSAKPSSTTTPKPSSGKRGLIYQWDGAADAKSFGEKRSYGFASNWEADSKGDIGKTKFIPTLRSLDRAGEWPSKVEAAISGGSDTVFTFNEPDIEGQANLGVAAACSAWQELVSPVAAKHPGVTIVGPSISSADPAQNPGKGLNWLKAFAKDCPQASWSAANYHWYGPASAGASAFKSYIEQANSEIGKPFYVTEYGLNPGATEAEAADFIRETSAYLDAHPNCLGYSYFAAGTFATGHVLLGNANSPTLAGSAYLE